MLGWSAVGVDLQDGGSVSVGGLDVSLRNPELIPWLIALVAVYQTYRFTVEWIRLPKADRTNSTTFLDHEYTLRGVTLGFALFFILDFALHPISESWRRGAIGLGAVIGYTIFHVQTSKTKERKGWRKLVPYPLVLVGGGIAIVEYATAISEGIPWVKFSAATLVVIAMFWMLPSMRHIVGLVFEVSKRSDVEDILPEVIKDPMWPGSLFVFAHLGDLYRASKSSEKRPKSPLKADTERQRSETPTTSASPEPSPTSMPSALRG